MPLGKCLTSDAICVFQQVVVLLNGPCTCSMLKATKALFDDFKTDKNIHLLRNAGAGQAKRMGESQPKLLCLLQSFRHAALKQLLQFQLCLMTLKCFSQLFGLSFVALTIACALQVWMRRS